MSAKMTIWLAGDSIVQSYGKDRFPQKGWGQELVSFFRNGGQTAVPADPNFPEAMRYEAGDVTIENRAKMMRSTKTFLKEGRLEPIRTGIKQGDWLLMQFGHNDACREKTERYCTLSEYRQNLMTFIEAARSHGAFPVLVTPTAMRIFDDGGKVPFAFSDYRKEMLSLSSEEDVLLIDLGALTRELVEKQGPERSRELYLHLEKGRYPAFPEGVEDDAHLSGAGARAFAGFVAGALRNFSDFPSECLAV
ncbi:MAG: rhamnogalacturonan acetylesterase [Lachnospiraceae bacterium]|jgi:lysophospholipase L1-like esterase|nr:rhamnogalacturonan acetylesterase [Lachnospiraceae bacterium]